ncbi:MULTISPECIES: hypothetical protein [Acidianus]|uniref:Uncharacterized protein n=1 Tax=Candidatus Acidianus copahuensis TaxID=1160895 RepID=A0A031LTC0_9CREN|nr:MULTISPECIES: hypothetical protein [Acidianus]EZQ11051.1 hypothetical protein CM19_02295 [Candidatus Acidianus copahuensis]NON62130.1 hypothetical protein [Acidianus sp. RZ1]
MKKSLEKRIIKIINDFFQYGKKGDEEVLIESLENVEYKSKKLIINNFEIPLEKKENIIGAILANIPLIILGEGEIKWDLPEKVVKVQRDALKLLEIGGFNELATLEIYLVIEMALRSLYSLWLGDVTQIKYGKKKIKAKDIDYRRLKLLIHNKGWSKYKVKVNGEAFPFSQGSLLSWAERFMDNKTSLAFRLAINVRNLLAHGEVEWELFPTVNSLYSSSYYSWLMFQRLKAKSQT